jgi:hypothetical protein
LHGGNTNGANGMSGYVLVQWVAPS